MADWTVNVSKLTKEQRRQVLEYIEFTTNKRFFGICSFYGIVNNEVFVRDGESNLYEITYEEFQSMSLNKELQQ